MVKLKFLPVSAALIATSLAFAMLAGCSSSSTSVPRAGTIPGSFAQLGDEAFATVTSPVWDAGSRRWNYCANFSSCGGSTNDWGADSMINIMYERWLVTRDPSIATSLLGFDSVHRFVDTTRTPRALAGSDVFMWDAVAKMRSYAATHEPAALQDAEAIHDSVLKLPFGRGACSALEYQVIDTTTGAPQVGGLKTLETDANRTLAAALFAENDPDPANRQKDLNEAKTTYAAIRQYFFDPARSLYTVYLLDDGAHCTQIPQRFFASVNGVMIEAGLELTALTQDASYTNDALTTAHAIAQLANDRGIFTDLQAENDIVEPLVLAMLKLSSTDGQARTWILQNAGAAVNARTADGLGYGRFSTAPPRVRRAM